MRCPNCGTGIDPDERYATLVVCPGCRAAIVSDQERLRVAGEMAVLAPATSGLAVGGVGQLRVPTSARGDDAGGDRWQGFQILGRVRYDYGKGQWDEWFLRLDAGGEAWLSEDAEGLRLEHRREAKAPQAHAELRLGKVLRLGKESFRVVEKGTARCVGAEGQLPFVVEPDEAVAYVDCRGRARSATLEYVDDERVVVYIGHPLGPSDLDYASAAGTTGPRVAAFDRSAALKCFACAAPLPAPEAGDEEITCRHCGSSTDLRFDQLTCQQCEAAIPVGAPDRAGTVVCPNCKTQHAIEQRVPRVLGSLADAQRPRVPLKLGTRCRFDGREQRIAGHLRTVETSYGTRYVSNEFLLVDTADRSYRWLECYHGHWTLTRSVEPPTRGVPAPSAMRSGKRFRALGRSWQVGEGRCTATIDWVEGELPWLAQRGDQVQYIEAADPPYQLVIETGGGEQEWLMGRYLEPREVAAAVGLPVDRLPMRRGVVWHQPFPASATRSELLRGAGVAALVFLVLAMYSCGSGTEVASFGLDGRAWDADGGYTSPPFTITEPGTCEVRYETRLSNEWAYLQCLLLDESAGVATHEWSQELSYYSGSDWSEGSRDGATPMLVTEPGEYRLYVADFQTGSGNSPQRHPDEQVTISVRQGVVLTRWFVLGTIAALLLVVGAALGPVLHRLKRMKEVGLIEVDSD